LGIAKALRFTDETTLVDVGTGGGFPGIPLAIMFPNCHFHLIDRIGKKVRVATEIAQAIGLDNVTFRHAGIEEEKQKFDFAISRAVMPLPDLVKLVRKNISTTQRNAMANGLLCLKGGDLEAEIAPLRKRLLDFDLKDFFEEEFFETKKVLYVQI
jgi:16S rRNA (guanine527-N7)-methyltransferase